MLQDISGLASASKKCLVPKVFPSHASCANNKASFEIVGTGPMTLSIPLFHNLFGIVAIARTFSWKNT
jgi:hypothetical protein